MAVVKSRNEMFSAHGLGFTPRAADTGITIFFYGDYNANEVNLELQRDHYDLTFTAHELIAKCLKKLNIGTVAFPLFYIYDLDRQEWLHPRSTVKCSEEKRELLFRARCMPSAHAIVNNLFPSDPAFARYFFLQMRHDFLNNRFAYGQSFGQERILGFVVMDLVRFGKERGLELKDIESLDLKHFIPVKCKELFKWVWDKHRLRNNIKPHLKDQNDKFKDHSAVKLMLNFILGLCRYIDDYGSECFILSKEQKVFISPYHPKYPGVYTYMQKDNEYIHFARIEDLVSINPTLREFGEETFYSVILNRMQGTPVDHHFRTWGQALSFVSLLNSYHRLMDDYHHQVCQEYVGCPLLERLRGLGSHGPVSKSWAETRLVEKNRIDVAFNYLLKQTSSSLDSLVLVYISETQLTEFFLIENTNGKYHLKAKDEQRFDSVEELLMYYKKSQSSRIKLEKCVRPTQPMDKKLLICQEDGTPTMVSKVAPKEKDTTATIVSTVTREKCLKPGQFTEVHIGKLSKDDSIKVAVKRLRQEDESTDALQYLIKAAHKATFWSHPTIVKIRAICLAPNFSLIMECGEMGNLEDYLKHLKEENHTTTNYVLIMVTEQLAQALLYLESQQMSPYPPYEKGCCHGNIRTRNILVFDHEEKMLRIKLGDPGMIYKYNKLLMDGCAERMPWIAPELYDNLDKMSIFSDRYAYGITVWEIMSNGERPFKYLSTSLEIQKYVREERKTLQKPQNCPDEIYNLMQKCWRLSPEDRISAKEIVRDVCKLIQSDYHSESYSVPQWDLQQQQRQHSGRQRRCSTPSINKHHHVIPMLDNGFEGSITYSSSSGSWLSSPMSDACDSATPLIGQRTPGAGTSMSSLRSSLSQDTLTTNLGESREQLAQNSVHMFDGTVRGKSRLKDDLPKTPDMPEPIQPLNHENLQWDQKRILGSGHYGEVYKGYFTTNHGNPRPVAIKRLKPEMYHKNAVEFEREFNIMIPLKHPRIVEIIGHCPQKDQNSPMLLVMEFVSKGSLKNFLKSNKGGLEESTLSRFSKEIAEGMLYLSQKNIFHGDLAARNILVTEHHAMKITDFGLAKAVENDKDYYKMKTCKELPVYWYPPEAIMNYKFYANSDVWSYGITVWEIFSYGDDPVYNIKSQDQLINHLHKGNRLEQPKACPDFEWQIMLECWEYDWSKRKDFPTILSSLERRKLMDNGKKLAR